MASGSSGEERARHNDANGVFTVFVDRVSKCIHRAALWEAFSDYGKISDVYIAYWNRKRRLMKHTFAFIRFFSKEDIQKAINGGNGRRMDGFFILDKEARFQRKASLEKKRQTRGIVAQRKSGIQVPSLRDGRSYKEALEGDRKSNLPDGGKMTQKWVERSLDQHDDSRVDPKAKVNIEPSIQLDIMLEEMKWVRRCLAGKIKSMYNYDVVQQSILVDGFPCKVSQ
ncbi:hypothetical protein V6N13_052101 [Hibiscus sabdariffa]